MNTVNRPADIRWWIWSFPISRDFDWSSSLWSSFYHISSFIIFWQLSWKFFLRWAGEFQGCPDLSSIWPIDMHTFSRNCKNIIVIIMTSKNLFLDKMVFTAHKDSYFGQKTILNNNYYCHLSKYSIPPYAQNNVIWRPKNIRGNKNVLIFFFFFLEASFNQFRKGTIVSVLGKWWTHMHKEQPTNWCIGQRTPT